ncbi:DNA-directed DNA polymerase delta subunit POL31 [Pneumocystis jirovecii RU7]|uniref:DNA-directed DNA polymerase n=1 Tax=Pneumocystis jirovecii (strain RU7) TaxID=1408657 RepID=A0A0W4ZUV7_PNEJ7|nr:DNA-directed DNA polymerase delta subunit POL31 [Pneumocystis jirovecii RU7]KTW32161.1 hypothetical protein T551_00843 [Pneumocystis jirovecii RU7]
MDSEDIGLYRSNNLEKEKPFLVRENVAFSVLHEEDYVLKKRTYQQQYANMYFLRLVHIRPKIVHQAQQNWGDMVIKDWKVKRASRLLDIVHGEICWIVGTVYVDAPLKPNILDDIKKDYWMVGPKNEKYIDSTNSNVILEDEYGRIRLVGSKILQEFLVTGCVIGALGFEIQNGNFEVIDLCFPELPNQISLPNRNNTDTHKYVALVSGLNITDKTSNLLPLFLLAEYLNGGIGHQVDRVASSQIVQFIIAGNSIALSETENTLTNKKKPFNAFIYNSKPAEMFDIFLSNICATTSVILMPGESDPSNTLLPQQPIHFSFIPNAKHYYGSTLKTSTNPMWLEIDGVKFLGSSGQTINDIYKYTNKHNKLSIMEYTLRWQHCAPTAPDTLWCYPFLEKDPFILSETPHVYFVGNQEEFNTKFIEGENGQIIRLIMLPVFSKTDTIVLLNLSTLECEEVKFGIHDKISI